MYVKFILPALAEAHAKYFRPIKYSLFPPLGLATLAGFLKDSDQAKIVDEHVQKIDLDDRPDLVAIETYVTSAKRAYRIADSYRKRGVYVVMGGLHTTACPDESLMHADTIVLGPAEKAWPRFLADFRNRVPGSIYRSSVRRLTDLPPLRRDLIRRKSYLVPNSIVVSRGCPHTCDFCYANSFFRGGKHFYTCSVDRALRDIQQLPGRHLFFLDDNIFGDPAFAASLFEGMVGMNRIWHGAATIRAILNTGLLDLAVRSGLRSLFIGFESLNQHAMHQHRKRHNRVSEYDLAVKMLHDRGVMINASFVFGLDGDTASVFDATTDWAITRGIETATFHLLTPYPGTELYDKYAASNRILHRDWDLYDTRHAVFSHPNMSGDTMERGYARAYEKFYKWATIIRSARIKQTWTENLRHITYVGAWKKFDPVWSVLIKVRALEMAIPALEKVLNGAGRIVCRRPCQSRMTTLPRIVNAPPSS